MTTRQTGITAALPPLARYLHFTLVDRGQLETSLAALARLADGEATVVGIGDSVVRALGGEVPGLRVFPSLAALVDVPATPSGVWCWLRGNDRGELLHRGREIEEALPAFALEQVTDAFRYGSGLDLTGYEDGTENPTGDDAEQVAFVAAGGAGIAGSSFVAVQQWVHDLDEFEAFDQQQQDHTIGRRLSDNEELDDAPPSAHVKRTAQESFTPEAFLVRRSMPWAEAGEQGLMFVAFANTLDAFEVQLARMMGVEDGITDALFDFTRPITGAYFWCPPLTGEGTLDLSAVLRD